MTFGEQSVNLKLHLSKIYDAGESAAIVELLLEHITGVDRNAQKIFGEKELTVAQQQQTAEALQKLLQHRPLQYVINEAWFLDWPFYVDESVLIPRPETEELVLWAIEEIQRNNCQTLLDIGTGSGCIPISIYKKTNIKTSAIDVDANALAVASKNDKKLNAAVDFIQIDFLQSTNWQSLKSYDIIVSNPPYIPENELYILNKNVTDWEPAKALFVPDEQPLVFYEAIAGFGASHLNPDGVILMECHQDFAEATEKMFQTKGYQTELRKDMSGNWRMLKAHRNF